VISEISLRISARYRDDEGENRGNYGLAYGGKFADSLCHVHHGFQSLLEVPPINFQGRKLMSNNDQDWMGGV
jgi:hypothetical protein